MADDQSFSIDAMVLERFDDLTRLIPDESPEKLELLSHYAILRFKQFMRRGNQEDLEEAIRKCREAVTSTAEDDRKFAGRLNNLGCMLGRRFKRTGRMEDLEEAIRTAHRAVDVTPDDHPDLAGRLNNPEEAI